MRRVLAALGGLAFLSLVTIKRAERLHRRKTAVRISI
jgi:hypothetical protein